MILLTTLLFLFSTNKVNADEISNLKTILKMDFAGKPYFCYDTAPAESFKEVPIYNSSSYSLNKNINCYRCCVEEIDKKTCDANSFKNFGNAKKGIGCGCV